MSDRTLGSLQLAKSKLSLPLSEEIMSSEYDANLEAIDGAVSDLQDSGGGSSPLQTATVTLSAAQIKALGSTPITLVAAPGVGKVLFPSQMSVQYKAGATPYAVFGALNIIYGALPHASYGQTFPLSGFLDQATNQLFLEPTTGLGPDTQANYENLALSILSTGPLTTSVLHSGGSGYAVNDIGDIGEANANGASYVVDSVDGAGAVLTYHLSSAGTGYSKNVNVATNPQSGGGSGFTVDINSVQSSTLGDGTLTVTVYYSVIGLS